MGTRPELQTSPETQAGHFRQPARIYSPKCVTSQQNLQNLQNRLDDSKATLIRRNGQAEVEKGVGTRFGAGETIAHERHRHVHDGQQLADLLHHDGLYAVQSADSSALQHPANIPEAGERWEQATDVIGEGGFRGV